MRCAVEECYKNAQVPAEHPTICRYHFDKLDETEKGVLLRWKEMTWARALDVILWRLKTDKERYVLKDHDDEPA